MSISLPSDSFRFSVLLFSSGIFFLTNISLDVGSEFQ
jgi:hypothetical protein